MRNETARIESAGSLVPTALGTIFDEYAPALYKYLFRLGVGSQAADQAVGDVFARLLEKLSEGKGRQTNLRSYLFQTAYHLIVDRARDSRRSPLDVANIV